ncbi:hypothetical protein V6N12_039925 [Hibiscus sabdariffa]|uniref:Uncharacterized protein n=1 Tax=Hibiscus sabdariffa TaxID=183260 RepID=A0ABR2E2S6_9ROSI
MMKEVHLQGTIKLRILSLFLKERRYIRGSLKPLNQLVRALGCDTNPGFVDEQGRLRIFPPHDFDQIFSCPPTSYITCMNKSIE